MGISTTVKQRILIISVIIVLSLLLLTPIVLSKTSVAKTYTANSFILGTLVKFTLYTPPPEALFDSLFSEIERYEALFSVGDEDSDVSKVNSAAGVKPVPVSPETMELLQQGVYYSELSGGRFDITIGPLVNLWRIGYPDARVPTQDEIDKVLPLIDYRQLELDSENGTAFLGREGMSIDLGAIAKGYIADRMVEFLTEYGITSGIINLGGNIVALGSKLDGKPFKIGIQHPRKSRGNYAGILSIEDRSIVSSGDYERFLERDGTRYHHILDTSTGYPASNKLTSVTIISSESEAGDALSTSTYAMGLEEGLALVNRLDGVEGVFITESKKIYTTPGVKSYFTLKDNLFTLQK